MIMKKIFTFLVASFVLTGGSLFAQVSPSTEKIQKQPALSFTEKKMKVISNPSESTELKPSAFTMECGVLPDSLKAYVDGQQQYITGTNGYGDEAYGQIFSTGMTTTVTSVMAYLAKAYDGGSATDIYAKVYAVNDGLPTTLLGTSQPVSPADIPDVLAPVTFSFETPVANVPADFAVVITVPEYAEESAIIVIASSKQGCFAPGQEKRAVSYSYISQTEMDWITIVDAYGIPVEAGFDLAIFPTVNETLGTNPMEKDRPSVFPNPATDKVYIENAAGATIRIYDISGKLLLEKKAQSVKESMDVTHLIQGVYFIEIQNKGIKTTQKLIKN